MIRLAMNTHLPPLTANGAVQPGLCPTSVYRNLGLRSTRRTLEFPGCRYDAQKTLEDFQKGMGSRNRTSVCGRLPGKQLKP